MAQVERKGEGLTLLAKGLEGRGEERRGERKGRGGEGSTIFRGQKRDLSERSAHAGQRTLCLVRNGLGWLGLYLSGHRRQEEVLLRRVT